MKESDIVIKKEFDSCNNYDGVETAIYNRNATSYYLVVFYDNNIEFEQCWYSYEYDRIEFLNDWYEGQEYFILGVLSLYMGVV